MKDYKKKFRKLIKEFTKLDNDVNNINARIDMFADKLDDLFKEFQCINRREVKK